MTFPSQGILKILRFLIVGATVVCAAALAQQATPVSKAGFAAVSSIRLEHDSTHSTLEITSTRPVTPQIQEIDSPPRIVIDLPNSRVAVRNKRINVQADKISAIRVDQFQDRPPVTRVVVDLLEPHRFHWSASGNVLLVTLEPAVETAPEPERTPSVTGIGDGAEPLAVPVSSSDSGVVMLAGSRLAAGSSVTAGGETARLQLARGGEVRVCPGTTVSVTPSPNGRDLMLALSAGAIETHYRLDASADSVLTPDFRIQFPGPGEFHFAISSDSHGNTCVRSMMGNTASAVVSELMGDRTYQVKPKDQLVFHARSLDRVDSVVPLECGCPPAPAPVMRAAAPAEVVPDSQLPASTRLANGDDTHAPDVAAPTTADRPPPQRTASIAGNETAPLPPSNKEDIHVQIDAPIVFRASDLPPAARLSQKQRGAAVSSANSVPESDPTAPLPKAATPTTMTVAKAEHRGLFRKIGGFFAAIFR